MTDKNLTDNENVKKIAFEVKAECFKKTVKEYFSRYKNESGAEDCIEICLVREGYRAVLGAEEEINRQKEEIERLQSILLSFTSEVETWSNKKGYDTTELSLIAILDEATNIKAEIKAEARKEFAAKLYNCFKEYETYDKHYTFEILDKIESVEAFFDNLLKELESEQNVD